MNGTVNGVVNVYGSDGKIAMQARLGDRVQITNGVLTRLERNGVMKLSGNYSILLLFVTMDTPTPPPVEPPPTGVTLKHTIRTYSDGSITIDGNPYP